MIKLLFGIIALIFIVLGAVAIMRGWQPKTDEKPDPRDRWDRW